MSYNAKVVLDSISPIGVRLTTLEVTFPRFILAEMNTHRVYSRNSASSRAVPTKKILDRVQADPVFPLEWGLNKAGMSAEEMLTPEDAAKAEAIWARARYAAVEAAQELAELKVHKQVVNRLVEPFLWHTAIISSTEWDNFFRQRLSPAAQPEMRLTAECMHRALVGSSPTMIDYGWYHLPYLQDDEHALPLLDKTKISSARCARVSYLNHDGKRDSDSDLALFNKLFVGEHLSPFEHVATPANDLDFHANFRGWIQLRKGIEDAHTLPLYDKGLEETLG